MKKAFLYFVLFALLASCNCKDDVLEVADTNATQVFCRSINMNLEYGMLSGMQMNDSILLDITDDENIDISFQIFDQYSNSGHYQWRKVSGRNDFQIARLAATNTSWSYHPDIYPDTAFYVSRSFVPKKFMQGAIVPNDTTFNSGDLWLEYLKGDGSMPNPIENGYSSDSPWYSDGEGYIVLHNQNTGVMGWIKIDLYGTPTIILSHFEVTDTLVIDEAVCQ